VIEILGAQESQTKTQEKCSVCYSRIYEDADPTPCVHDEETIILGSMLARADLVEVARSILKEDNFDIEEHRMIYKAILDLFEQGGLFRRDKKPSVDSVLHKMGIPANPSFNVHYWLEERGDKVPLSYLVMLETGCCPAAVFDPESPVSAEDMVAYYAYQVKKKAIVRNLQESRLTSEARDGIQDHLGTIDYGIKQTQTYWLVKHEEEESQVPLWYSSLRPELRPTGERIDTLETLRAKYEIPHDVFWKALASYPGAARLVQINLYRQAKEKWPNLSKKDLLKNIFVGRALKPEPNGYGMTRDKFKEVMEKINSLEELCDYVVLRDSKEPTQQFDLSEWQANVEMLKKAGVGTDELQRHMRNAERLQRDNVRGSICGIMEEEARLAMVKVEQEAGAKSENNKEHPQNRTMQQEMRKDSEWTLIEDEPCRVIDFTPLARVENGRVIAPNMTDPYASLILECKKMPEVIRGYVTHKIDFANLWAAFEERGISDNEEVIIIWTTQHYKHKISKLLLPIFPKLWVMVYPKGALEIMVDPNWKPELTGGARWNAMTPIAKWKPEIMK